MKGYYSVDSFEATESIGFLLRRCATLMAANGERVLAHAELPLSVTQWIVLMRLRGDQALSASTLAGDIGHDLGSLTRVVDSLVAHGYVRRTRSLLDRRGVELRLASAGRQLTDAQLPMMVAALNDLLAGFKATEQRQLHRLLMRLMQTLQHRLEPHPASAPVTRPAKKISRSSKT